jgi:hypothetical protein
MASVPQIRLRRTAEILFAPCGMACRRSFSSIGGSRGAQHFVDRHELTGEADRIAHARRVCRDVVPMHDRFTVIGTQQRRENARERGLAPFEPSSAKMLPRVTSKSTPRNTRSPP